jgi:hypothetical protein
MPTIFLIALRIGGAVVGSLSWYWRLPQLVRQAADARTRDYIERTFRTSIRSLSAEEARTVYDWARAQHA